MITTLALIMCSFSATDAIDVAQVSGESLASFFLWDVIHESSHAFVMGREGYKDISIKPYPHNDGYGFVWASAQGTPTRQLSTTQSTLVSLAPRGPDLLAAILFPCLARVSYDNKKLLYPFVLGGLVDMFTGSLGLTQYSDLQQAFPRDSGKQNIVRVAGFAIITASVLTWYFLQK
jgi:hypothetical protein